MLFCWDAVGTSEWDDVFGERHQEELCWTAALADDICLSCSFKFSPICFLMAAVFCPAGSWMSLRVAKLLGSFTGSWQEKVAALMKGKEQLQSRATRYVCAHTLYLPRSRVSCQLPSWQHVATAAPPSQEHQVWGRGCCPSPWPQAACGAGETPHLVPVWQPA